MLLDKPEGKPEFGSVRGRFRKLRLAEGPPHPYLLPARGEKEPAGARTISENQIATAHARCGIFGRSPLALPVIGGRGSRALPGSITNVWSSEYQGPATSGAGGRSFTCLT